jgi:hypothetical protein
MAFEKNQKTPAFVIELLFSVATTSTHEVRVQVQRRAANRDRIPVRDQPAIGSASQKKGPSPL